MNSQALNQDSSIQISETATGKAKCGFRTADGVRMEDKEYFEELEKNGYKIEFTPNGVVISKD